MRCALAVLTLFLELVFGLECDSSLLASNSYNNISMLGRDATKSIDHLNCSRFKDIKSKADFLNALETHVQTQTDKVLKIKDRHAMAETLNSCEPSLASKALVLSFAGTGAFNPRSHQLMATLIKCPEFQALESKHKKYLHHNLLKILEQKSSKFTNWSGIDKGVMGQFISNDKIRHLASKFDFATFASEESELIANPSDFSISTIKSAYREIENSFNNNPVGIQNALSCASLYFKRAKELGISTKLIVFTHSSGGRSAVKFLERMKGIKNSDLTITIDPVIEVQHAVAEIVSQEIGNAQRKLVGIDEKPVNVWSRKQPKKLYKVNSKRWINFYQQNDTKGFDMKPSFGIQGSPVEGANNVFLKDLSAKAHGEITYDKSVLEKVIQEISQLFEPNKS